MDNKKLISQEELCSLVGELMLPMISRIGGVFLNSYKSESGVGWILADSTGRWMHRCGARLHNKEYWNIYNNWYKLGNINIEIHNDHIKFIEHSKFKDFSRDEMYSLYTFLNERLFGVKENKEENING